MATFIAGIIFALLLVAVVVLLYRLVLAAPRSVHRRNFGHVGQNAPWRPADAEEEAYRERWDPYDPAASRSARVRAARRKRRAGTMPRASTYYALLGLEPNATDREIERAYRQRVAQIHPDRYFDDPDRQRGAEAQLRELNAAMEVLRDPLRRAKYDATL